MFFPKKITRYVLWELTKVFLISSFGFVALMLIVGLVEEASDRGIGPDIVVRIIPYIFPRALMFAMPATCLLSVCVVYGRMSADNELVAIKAAGLHQSVIIVPTLFVAFLLSLFAVWINDVSFAWSYWGIENVIRKSSHEIVYGVLKNEGSFRTDTFSIEVQGVEDRRLIHPAITYRKDHQTHRLVAHEAIIDVEPETHSLILRLFKGKGTFEDKGTYIFDDESSHRIELMSPEEMESATGNPSHLYLSEIGGEVTKQRAELSVQAQANAVRACNQLLAGDLLALTDRDWDDRKKELEDSQNRLTRLELVPHRRWANGFSCLAFAIIGVPMAIRLRTSNYATTFGICFLPILFMYYPLFMYGLNGAKMGTLPPYSAWLGNLACLIVGSCLLYSEYRK